MTTLAQPVTAYMTSDLVLARPSTPLIDVAARLATRNISAVPVVDDDGALVGVVSRYDLVHHRRLHPHADEVTCAAIMTRAPVTVGATEPMIGVARLMVAHRIHRVFVVDAGRLAGVVTTTDVTRAVEDAGVAPAIDTIMSAPVVTIRVDQTLALAMEWLDRAHVTGLIVTDNDWPIGVFAQEDALAARDLAPETVVGSLYDPSLICLPRDTPIHRAAAQCARMGVRRIVVSHHHDFIGVVTGLDFAAAAAATGAEVAA